MARAAGPDTEVPGPGAPAREAAEPGDDGARLRPTEVLRTRWREVGRGVLDAVRRHQVPLLASGVAFWALLSLFPALIAVVSLYGLVADPQTVADQVENLADSAPESVRTLLTEQLSSIVGSTGSGLGAGLVLGIVVALWTASSGMRYLVVAVNLAFDRDETRGYVKVRGLALALTLGAVLLVALAIGVIAVLPPVLDRTGLDGAARIAAQWLPFLLLALGFAAGCTTLYRLAPDRPSPRWRLVTEGAAVATVVWIVASLGFSWYVSSFGSYNDTYGSIGAVVVLMLWLFLTALAVVLGAELDHEVERAAGRAPGEDGRSGR